MSQKNVYKIGKIHQLFDLNNDALNFLCNFRIMADAQQKHFEYLVVSQEQLDSIETLPKFNKAEGVGVGRVVADKGQKQTFFLALRSDDDQSVQVETHFEKLPDDHHIQKQHQQHQQQQEQQEQEHQQQQEQQEHQQQEQEHQLQQQEEQYPRILHGDQDTQQNGDPQREFFHQHEIKESFMGKMLKNKFVWLLLTIAVLVAVYFMFFVNRSATTTKDSSSSKDSSGKDSSGKQSTGKDSSGKQSSNINVLDEAINLKNQIGVSEGISKLNQDGVKNIKTGGLNIDELNKLAH